MSWLQNSLFDVCDDDAFDDDDGEVVLVGAEEVLDLEKNWSSKLRHMKREDEMMHDMVELRQRQRLQRQQPMNDDWPSTNDWIDDFVDDGISHSLDDDDDVNVNYLASLVMMMSKRKMKKIDYYY